MSDTTQVDTNAEDVTADNQESDEKPYYLLLQQQKRKYQAFIERISNDNKRKQQEIDCLRAELKLVRDVLAVAGLDLDLVELRSLVQSKPANQNKGQDVKDFAGRASKIGILPPIPKTDGIPQQIVQVNGALVTLDSKARHPVMAEADYAVAAIAAGAYSEQVPSDTNKSRPTSGSIRAHRYRHTHADGETGPQAGLDYHNANLDYHHRSHMFRAPPPPSESEGTPLHAPDPTGHQMSRSPSWDVMSNDTVVGGEKDGNVYEGKTIDLERRDSLDRILPPILNQVNEGSKFLAGLNPTKKPSMSSTKPIPAIPSSTANQGKSSSTWMKRMKGSKLLKEKQWKELHQN
jgi:hypothetical protein